MISVNQSNKEALAAILIWLMADPFFGLVYCLYLFIFSVLPHMVPDSAHMSFISCIPKKVEQIQICK